MPESTGSSWDMDASARDRRQQEVGGRTPMDGFTVCPEVRYCATLAAHAEE